MKEIPVLGGAKCAVVDDDRFEEFSRHKWRLSTCGRVCRTVTNAAGKRVRSMMHHEVAGKPEKGFVVDHVHGDIYDNRASQLRHATFSQSIGNTSVTRTRKEPMPRGVVRTKRGDEFYAYTRFDKHYVTIGRFRTIAEAAHAFDVAAFARWGEFAKLNCNHWTQYPDGSVPIKLACVTNLESEGSMLVGAA